MFTSIVYTSLSMAETGHMASNGPSDTIIQVHPDTNNSTVAWQKIRTKQRQRSVVDLLPIDTAVRPDMTRFVCISDTHNQIDRIPKPGIPDGDVLLHAGDFSSNGRTKDVKAFNLFLVSVDILLI